VANGKRLTTFFRPSLERSIVTKETQEPELPTISEHRRNDDFDDCGDYFGAYGARWIYLTTTSASGSEEARSDSPRQFERSFDGVGSPDMGGNLAGVRRAGIAQEPDLQTRQTPASRDSTVGNRVRGESPDPTG